MRLQTYVCDVRRRGLAVFVTEIVHVLHFVVKYSYHLLDNEWFHGLASNLQCLGGKLSGYSIPARSDLQDGGRDDQGQNARANPSGV